MRLLFLFVLALTCSSLTATARRVHLPGGRRAVVIDERLAALREEPRLEARLIERLGRGRTVSIIGSRKAPDSLLFYRVGISRKKSGWLQADSVVMPGHSGDDDRCLRIANSMEGFERVELARICLDTFPRSNTRPRALLLIGDTAEEAAQKLSHDADRRLDERDLTAGGAPLYSYYMNYSGLDRYSKQGVSFIFDKATKQIHYDGATWREIIRKYPNSPEAVEARKRLAPPQPAPVTTHG